MAEGIYKATEWFESALCEYTGAPLAVAVDNCSNALFLSLKYKGIEGMTVSIPSHTYPSVPNSIIHAGGKVLFKSSQPMLTGAYELEDTGVWDSALRFTSNMYIPNTLMCLSFSGPYKHLKLGKGGAILTDDYNAYLWFKRARFSGRREMSYHEDSFDMLGWNFYMMPDVAMRGFQLMKQFYDVNGEPKQNEDVSLPYPNLSLYPIYQSHVSI